MHMAFADTFKALSDPARRQILELLKKGPLSAGDIASHFDMTGATISYHLKILKKADLIFESKEKNFIYYQLNATVLEEIMLWLSSLQGGDTHVESKSKDSDLDKRHHTASYDDWSISMEAAPGYNGNTFRFFK